MQELSTVLSARNLAVHQKPECLIDYGLQYLAQNAPQGGRKRTFGFLRVMLPVSVGTAYSAPSVASLPCPSHVRSGWIMTRECWVQFRWLHNADRQRELERVIKQDKQT
ncbi:MAG: hypothetical protein OXE78_10765 [Gammaproteobacteria bacterium]|nr:hypothetical protein [Gammaproteobacteria bacterium]